MKRFTPITQFILTIALFLALAFNVNAQIDTLDTEAESITFSLAGQNAKLNNRDYRREADSSD